MGKWVWVRAERWAFMSGKLLSIYSLTFSSLHDCHALGSVSTGASYTELLPVVWDGLNKNSLGCMPA